MGKKADKSPKAGAKSKPRPGKPKSGMPKPVKSRSVKSRSVKSKSVTPKSDKIAKSAEAKSVKTAAVPAEARPAAEPAGQVQESSTVDLWFDPSSPWAWIASRWMLEVETVRPVKTFFHVTSLAVQHESKDIPEEDRRVLDGSWPAARVALAVGRHYGQEQLAAFYTALGTRIHVREEGENRDTVAAALADVGLPPELIELGDIGDNDDALRASTWAGMNLVGLDVGTPVLQINGRAFFGPVFSPRPRGEEAGRVFDGVLALASYPGFFELRRTRDVGPIYD